MNILQTKTKNLFHKLQKNFKKYSLDISITY